MQFKNNIIVLLTFILAFSTTIIANPTECQPPHCPFTIKLNDLEPLRHNQNISTYQIKKMDAKNVKVTGKLQDGHAFEINLTAGDVFSRTHRKMIANSSKNIVDNKNFWLQQTLQFAKEVWDHNRYQQLKHDLIKKQFSVKTKKAIVSTIRLEKYNEGNVTAIEITQSSKEIIITLQQSAC